MSRSTSRHRTRQQQQEIEEVETDQEDVVDGANNNRGNAGGGGGGTTGTGTDTDQQTDTEGGCFEKAKHLFDKNPMQSPKKRYKPTTTTVGTPTSSARTGVATPTPMRRQPLRNARTPNAMGKLTDPVQVYCRIRPIESNDGCIRINDNKSLTLTPPENSLQWRSGMAKEQTYSFERVFDDIASQKAIFDQVALPLLKDFLDGKNALLFAYGVTGSGKTFTMTGTPNECGITPRCLDIIFNSISEYKAVKHVFKPDRLNGFEVQSKADAMLERQREFTANIPKTPRPRAAERAAAARQQLVLDFESDKRFKDTTTLPITNKDVVYSVFITYVEIYNNFVYDLLDESPIEINRKAVLQSKMLREDPSHNVYVNAVTEVEVESTEEAFEILARGQRRRRMAHTALNAESSRSHSIFNIRLVQARIDPEGADVMDCKSKINVSQLSLVDLAGSERHCRTESKGDRLREAGNINNSLMTLRKCMDILRDNQQNNANKMVPYRDSKLTHFLKNYFEGEGRVRMILCVNPQADDYDENIHVFVFADLTQEVQVSRPQGFKLEPAPASIAVSTPHRRKATKELFKEPASIKRRAVEEHVMLESNAQSEVNLVYGLGPPLPVARMLRPTDELVLSNLKQSLELRKKARADLLNVIMDKKSAFRSRLVTAERSNDVTSHDNILLKTKMEQLLMDKESTENVLRTVQHEKVDMEKNCEEQETLIRKLREELEDFRMQMRQNEIAHMKERERLKSDLELQRELDERKLQRKLIKGEAELQETYKEKDKTIEAMKKLVSNVDLNSSGSKTDRVVTTRSSCTILRL